ncbi:hypothetical protein SAMN06295912_103232 [Sphingomonas laterariae]|uniref:Uncharacterized protein n=1 Tax=Edaphosphingomonas laterariae TaxID=861865 RepID=A0A239D789_9SPHN|nr:hypothetical protein SAMN06295912_103232 [Sphingomonas laterariae]
MARRRSRGHSAKSKGSHRSTIRFAGAPELSCRRHGSRVGTGLGAETGRPCVRAVKSASPDFAAIQRRGWASGFPTVSFPRSDRQGSSIGVKFLPVGTRRPLRTSPTELPPRHPGLVPGSTVQHTSPLMIERDNPPWNDLAMSFGLEPLAAAPAWRWTPEQVRGDETKIVRFPRQSGHLNILSGAPKPTFIHPPSSSTQPSSLVVGSYRSIACNPALAPSHTRSSRLSAVQIPGGTCRCVGGRRWKSSMGSKSRANRRFP